MIHYYNNNKHGLHLAVFHRTLAQSLQRLFELVSQSQHDSGGPRKLRRNQKNLLNQKQWIALPSIMALPLFPLITCMMMDKLPDFSFDEAFAEQWRRQNSELILEATA